MRCLGLPRCLEARQADELDPFPKWRIMKVFDSLWGEHFVCVVCVVVVFLLVQEF